MEEPAPLPISRAMVTAARDPATCTLEAIDAALAACDHERAAVLAFARASTGLEVPARTIVEIVLGIDHPDLAIDLIAIASGDRADALLDAIERRRFPPQHGQSIEMIALFAAWRSGAEQAAVVRHARRLAVYELGSLGLLLLAAVARAIDDADLRIACAWLEEIPERGVASTATDVGTELRASIDDILARYPEQVTVGAPAGFTVRAAPRVGRNEPCPCGSGQKFKRCCADKETRTALSPVPGLTWDEYVRTAGDRMSPEDVATLSLRDLVRVDLSQLPDRSLREAYHRFLDVRRWDHAARAADALGQRSDADHADEWREELIHSAFECRELAVVEQQLALISTPEIRRDVELELALARRAPDAFERLIAAARDAVADEDAPLDIELAHALLRSVPPLGILVARGCIRAKRGLDAEVLLEMIEEARIELGLPAGDRGWDVLAMFEQDAKSDDDDDASEELRTSLRHQTARIQQLEAELASQRDALATAREELPVQRQATAVEPERVRELRTKIERLEGLVREGLAERTELRQQLAASSTTRTTRDEPAQPVEHEDDGEAIEDAPRDVLLPSFDRRVIDALDGVPRQVAAEAMRTIGAIAAGDHAAWRRLKQAKDMRRQVLMARIGIHHRLLLRTDAPQLVVLDLVPREALDTTLKRLRSS